MPRCLSVLEVIQKIKETLKIPRPLHAKSGTVSECAVFWNFNQWRSFLQKKYANCTDVETRRLIEEANYNADADSNNRIFNVDLGRHLRDPDDYTARRSSLQGGFCEVCSLRSFWAYRLIFINLNQTWTKAFEGYEVIYHVNGLGTHVILSSK